MVACDPQPDSRVPDKQAFKSIAPGGSIEATSRLIELCPDDTFARPGLYLARARFSPSVSGNDFGIEAVTGHFTSEQPAVIRIRSGELLPQEPPARSLQGRERVAVLSERRSPVEQRSQPRPRRTQSLQAYRPLRASPRAASCRQPRRTAPRESRFRDCPAARSTFFSMVAPVEGKKAVTVTFPAGMRPISNCPSRPVTSCVSGTSAPTPRRRAGV